MKKWLRRIRGAVGLGLTWAAAWFGAFAIYWITPAVVGGTLSFGLVAGLLSVAVLMGGIGFVGGAIFSTVLGIAGRRSRFDELSLPRFAAWGALGGLLVCLVATLVFGDPVEGVLWLATVGTLLGAGSSAGSLALARMADDRELLEDGADVADIGLSEQETRELLGK